MLQKLLHRYGIFISECIVKLAINIHLKAAFRSHLDIYDENGQLTDQAFADRKIRWQVHNLADVRKHKREY